MSELNKRGLWWRSRQKVDPYLFYAEAPSKTVKAPLADEFGLNRSAGFQPGVRTFCFKEKEARDRFCEKYNARLLEEFDV